MDHEQLNPIDKSQQEELEKNRVTDNRQWAAIITGLVLLGYVSLIVLSFNFNKERRLIIQIERPDLKEICGLK